MFNILRKSFSGDSSISRNDRDLDSEADESLENPVQQSMDTSYDKKNSKRTRSGDTEIIEDRKEKSKKKKLARGRRASSNPEDYSDSTVMDTSATVKAAEKDIPLELPQGTPDWGIKLLEIMKAEFKKEFKKVTDSIGDVKKENKENSVSIHKIEDKVAKIEEQNRVLTAENGILKERLLDLEFRQRRNNLIFDGIVDSDSDSDLECIKKLRFVLKDIPGLQVNTFQIERCHRLDGAFKPGRNRRLICAFNWHYDVLCILKNRKRLPRGVFVSEDLPEEWVDRRRILKPIYNAAKRMEKYKSSTYLTKDKLVIDGKSFMVSGPDANLQEANDLLDISASCERRNEDTILFLGSHSVLSNLHYSPLCLDNTRYNSVEQYYQSEKAMLFDDDRTHSKIMSETNPYRIMKLGSRVRNFTDDRWRRCCKQLMYKAIKAKFTQNPSLKHHLLTTSNKMLAESSKDDFWGTGLHLFDRAAFDKQLWKNEGGVMSSILQRVRSELRAAN